MNADGSNQTPLTTNFSEDEFPTWSPSGDKIAFRSLRDSNQEIYVMNTDGSGITRVTDDPADDFGVVWSPGGWHIAFNSDRAANVEIYIVRIDGSLLTQLTFNDQGELSFDGDPDWSF
jgi:TolB protein